MKVEKKSTYYTLNYNNLPSSPLIDHNSFSHLPFLTYPLQPLIFPTHSFFFYYLSTLNPLSTPNYNLALTLKPSSSAHHKNLTNCIYGFDQHGHRISSQSVSNLPHIPINKPISQPVNRQKGKNITSS